MLPGMGKIEIGTAGWTDRTLIASGWYPPEANKPEKRLRYYASQFALVEVDATYYALPAEQTAAAWAARTPAGFTFNIKAFSLFTQHPTPVTSLPADLRAAAAQDRQGPGVSQGRGSGRGRSGLGAVPGRAGAAAGGGKLGAILLQFPPWFPISRANKEYIVVVRAAGGAAAGVRGIPQPDLDDRGQPGGEAGLPAENGLPYVCVDMPQGYPARSRRCWPPPATWPWCACTATRTSGRPRPWPSGSATGTARGAERVGAADRGPGREGRGDAGAVQQLLQRLRPPQRAAGRDPGQLSTGVS